MKKHYNISKQADYERLVLGYNEFLRKSGLIDYNWPEIGDFLQSEDVTKERKLQIYSEYIFASTEVDYRINPLTPNRDHDTRVKIMNRCKVFKQELRNLEKKKSAKITKKKNPVELTLYKSAVSLEIANYEAKLVTFFSNRYDDGMATYIQELETVKRPIRELDASGLSFKNDATNETTELLCKLVLSESQRQPSSVPSRQSSYPATPSLQNIGSPQISSTPRIQPLINNVEISEPPKKRVDFDSQKTRAGLGSCFGLRSPTKKRHLAVKSITHVTHNNVNVFSSNNLEQNSDSENSDSTDDHQSPDEQYFDDRDVREQCENSDDELSGDEFSEDFEVSGFVDESYSPTTREKRLQYSIDKDHRPADRNQSSRILTDIESIDNLLQKALKHECRNRNTFGTRTQSLPVKPTPVIEIHNKPNFETKGVNLQILCKTCDESVYSNPSMLNERFLIKNTACWISLLFGQSYRESQAYYSLLGLPFYKDPGTFYTHRRKIAKQIASAKSSYSKKYRKRAFNHPKNLNNFVLINGQKRRKLEAVSLDGSWNTRGWHAFDCIMYSTYLFIRPTCGTLYCQLGNITRVGNQGNPEEPLKNHLNPAEPGSKK